MKKRIAVDGQTNVAEWYKGSFPTDLWAIEQMNKGITFQDVYECLYVGFNVYALLGVSDSIVRERVFEKLAELMGRDYNYVYLQWMGETIHPLGLNVVTDMKQLSF